ncbi:hypothetical protein C8A01DRAFT_51441 [Parachaetomium inaequale]|uniref:Uncharacterized protein n=1 Tax=Parachaetomium inaequale TaxID=2588326 RepID=A0AAN6SKA4_9PEZI|nr:hypothetical protein C8A01DRAFT_51441 [Parachaetomium inaequale]
MSEALPKEILEYEEKPEWRGLQHPWNLEPSEELDAVWEDLLYALNIRISEDEINILHENRTNRVKVNGGGYAGVLGVYHHMHCLNNLRRVVHWDFYGPTLATAKHAEGFSKEHSAEARLTGEPDHCIDAIRQALMCHANTALYTAEWMNDSHVPINKELRSGAVTTCVKWDSLDRWARKKALVPGHYQYLPGPYEVNRVEDGLSGRST